MSTPLARPVVGRRIVDLDFPHQVLVWALRRAASGDRTGLDRGLAQVFGSERAGPLAHCLCTLVTLLDRMTPGCLDGEVRTHLCAAENEVLGALASARQGHVALAATLCASRTVNPQLAARLEACLLELGDLLNSFPARAPAPAAMPPAGRRSDALLDAEQALVVHVRHWVAAVRAAPARDGVEAGETCLRRRARGHGEAMHCMLEAVAALLRQVGYGARQPVEVHAPGCACLAADEMRLLGAVAAHQHGQPLQASALLRDWLHGEHLLRGLAAAARAARWASSAGLQLPLRDWVAEAGPGTPVHGRPPHLQLGAADLAADRVLH